MLLKQVLATCIPLVWDIALPSLCRSRMITPVGLRPPSVIILLYQGDSVYNPTSISKRFYFEEIRIIEILYAQSKRFVVYLQMFFYGMKRKVPHYGWLIVLSGTLCIFACLGLGRFTIGMILPSMATSLGLTYSQMGLISTANFVGYLISVFVSGIIVRKTGARSLIFSALLIVGSSIGSGGISRE
ncbi:MAG: YbfB/YjiJ family MFS transporter [Thermodesulfovibrionales bacterium]